MFTFNILQWVPDFILADKNGYAIAKALQAGINYMNNTLATGVKLITDYDSMPEWRLDELAWETNCLYDYKADIEVKRKWIKEAIPLYRLYGTPEAVYKFLGSYFDNIEVNESWQYGGQPFHFKVMVEGDWTPENEAWARKAIDAAKNVRSVLDDFTIGNGSYIGMTAEGEVLARFLYPFTGPDFYAGTWPQDNTIAVIDSSGKLGADNRDNEYKFPYTMTGTVPETNTLGEIDEGGRAGFTGEAQDYVFPYSMTSEDLEAGTVPQENMIGEICNNNIQSAQSEDSYATIQYRMCGEDEI